VLAAALMAACSNGDDSKNTAGTGGSTTTVLNVGMPNGPQTENHNPFLGSRPVRRWVTAG
jgi:peptide/nickel transport system substrate-binding protein